MSLDTFKGLLNGRGVKDFCPHLKAKALSNLDNECLQLITAECGELIPPVEGWKELETKKLVKIPPAAFSRIPGAHASYIDISSLTDQQLAEFGNSLPADMHPASHWTEEFFRTISKERVRVLRSTAIGALQPNVIAGMTVEQWTQLPPESLITISQSQAKAIPADRWKLLTEEGAKQIGAAQGTLEESPLPVILESRALEGTHVGKLIRDRLETLKKPIPPTLAPVTI